MRYIPASKVATRTAAWRHLRVKGARRSRTVPLKREIMAVLNSTHPFVNPNSSFAFSLVPRVTFRVISTTRFFARMLDNRRNTQIGPDFQMASSSP
jgi:hypothetical protein